jgi:hypothetical protein
VDVADCQPALLAATVMNAFEHPWCVAGGWAIDLWLGRATRAHADVEVAIFRDDQIALRDFLGPGWKFEIATPQKQPRPWHDDRQMLMLPIHEIHAVAAGGRRRLEFLLNECDTVDWIYRRDGRVRWPKDQWTVTGAFGVPALAPHIALLYKSKNPRPQDELDLRSALPSMEPELRRWLGEAIRCSDENHPWLTSLVPPPSTLGGG